MPRRWLAVLLVALAAVPPHARAETPAPWSGEPTLIAGTSRYDAGEWIYTDFVYDDYGADTVPAGQPNVVSLASTAGDFRYPNGTTAAGNAADIVEVRARAVGDDLELRVLLQSIVNPETPALRIEANGVQTIVTARNAVVDADANTITVTLPDAASGDTVALNVGAGLHDGNGGLRGGVPGFAQAMPGEFTTGAPTANRLFDLAFNTHEIEGRGGAWNENVQSASLASGALGRFTQTIDVGSLRAGVTTPVPPMAGYFVRIFDSRQELGEGMAGSFPQYRGTWQPYAVWVPGSYSPGAPTPLLLMLHSLSVHHNQYRGGPSPSASYKTFYEQVERGLGPIVVTPLGRGPDGWYEDAALVDTLEVWADARRRYTIDDERTFVGGYSMGGYGTYRLTTLMPDSFASAVSIVGPPANGIWPYPLPPTSGEANPDNTYPQLESTRHVPFWITQGVLDELVPVSGVTRQAMRFGELGHEYRFALHPAEDHLSFAYKDVWTREVAWWAAHPRRVTNPRRITFDVRPASWATGGNATILALLRELTAEVGARLDGAYWVDDIAVAEGADATGVVDLTSGGIARSQSGITPVAAPGVDGPSPYALTGQDAVWTTVATTDAITGRLANVTAITIDVGRAGLSDSPDLSGIAVTGGPVTVTLVREGAVVGQRALG